MNFEAESKRLEGLRSRQNALAESISQSRRQVADLVREVREARIQFALDPESGSEKKTESRCRELEGQRAALQNDIDKRVADLEILTSAVKRLEAEIIPQRHQARLERQQEVQVQYRDLCLQILEAANRLAELNDQAMKAFHLAEREFRSDELCAGKDVVLRNAGLRAVHDVAWISFPGQPSRRDWWVNQVLSFARELVPENDPAAISRRHQEEFFARLHGRYEVERLARIGQCEENAVKFRKTTLAERQTGEWVPENENNGRRVHHPLSRAGIMENLGLVKRV